MHQHGPGNGLKVKDSCPLSFPLQFKDLRNAAMRIGDGIACLKINISLQQFLNDHATAFVEVQSCLGALQQPAVAAK
jgi:hypothetical protein